MNQTFANMASPVASHSCTVCSLLNIDKNVEVSDTTKV